MAQAMGCDLCGQETAVLLQTNIDNGDVIAIGGSCMVTFLLSTAATILDEMPADHVAAYGEIIRPVSDRLAAHLPAADLEAMQDGIPMPLEAADSAAVGEPAADVTVPPATAAAAPPESAAEAARSE